MYGGGAAAVAVGGFLVLGGGGPGSGPAGTAEKFVNALDAGNQDRVEQLLHSEASGADQIGFMMGVFEQAEINVQGTEVVEEREQGEQQIAVVDVQAEATVEGATNTDTLTIELRTEDGDWKVWNLQQ
jgi:hypothetical protein